MTPPLPADDADSSPHHRSPRPSKLVGAAFIAFLLDVIAEAVH
jgi:hypothetical protein